MSKPGPNRLRRLIVDYACREFERTTGKPLVEIALDLHARRVADPGQEPFPETLHTFTEPCQGTGEGNEERGD
jgi:hypothetical protein